MNQHCFTQGPSEKKKYTEKNSNNIEIKSPRECQITDLKQNEKTNQKQKQKTKQKEKEKKKKETYLFCDDMLHHFCLDKKQILQMLM